MKIVMLLKECLINKQSSDKIAVKYMDKSVSYRQLYHMAEKCAQTFKPQVSSTKNICIFLPNSLQYIVAYFAITFLDRVIVPVNIQFKKIELLATIEYCESDFIITDTKQKKFLKEYFKESDYSIHVFNIDDYSIEKFGNGIKAFDGESVQENPCETDTALMLHTSGTTSLPKRVMLSHKNLIINALSIIESLKLSENDITLISLPLTFASANTSQLLTHIILGASIVILDGMLLPPKFFNIVEKEEITNFTCVPSVLAVLLDDKNCHNRNLNSLRFICFGGGATPVQKIKEIMAAFPDIDFIHMYGQTEASTRICHLLKEASLRKIGSVGKAIPGVNIRIVDENGKDVNTGEIGEILVRGGNVMKGYFKRPYETRKTLRNGWLYTGDLARCDHEGYIYIVGRRKNVIISGGINIYPEEVEEILMTHPSVKEAWVLGESDEIYGEVPVAKIVLKENIPDISEDNLIRFCFANLAVYKIPKKVYFTEQLSRTSTGKIRRY